MRIFPLHDYRSQFALHQNSICADHGAQLINPRKEEEACGAIETETRAAAVL
jgi:hypothetical protein